MKGTQEHWFSWHIMCFVEEERLCMVFEGFRYRAVRKYLGSSRGRVAALDTVAN
jgi:hypothetical protein